MVPAAETRKHRKSKKNKALQELKFVVETNEYQRGPIPGYGSDAKFSECFVHIEDLPKELEDYMDVNPRTPSRKKTDELSGPIVKAIKDTIQNSPEEMVIKNQGIYLLVDSARYLNQRGKAGKVTLTLNDPGLHGIVNGGHTYAAIREVLDAVEELEEGEERDQELNKLTKAFVKLHIYEGIPQEKVSHMAEGLNRSKQVDDASLANLQGGFDIIKNALDGVLGSDEVSYHQGDPGEVYITEVLACAEMFNQERFDAQTQPNKLYRKAYTVMKMFMEDKDKPSFKRLVKKLPEIMILRDTIKKLTPEASKDIGFQFGRMKVTKKAKKRAKVKDVTYPLPFLGDEMEYKIPNGWVYPMLAAFRANLDKNGDWIMNPLNLLDEAMRDLVGVCVAEHRDNDLKPESLGNKESAYRQCYTAILLKLARKGYVS